MKIFRRILTFLPLLAALTFAGAYIESTTVSAACEGVECVNQTITKTGGDAGEVDTLAKTITETILFILGGVAVIMIVVGGFRFVTSAGDAQAVKSARNTVLYAVIGLVIAIAAYAAVRFVLVRLGAWQ